MKTSKLILSAFIGTALLASCSSSNEVEVVPQGNYDFGILVSNEGAFNGGTGTINFISDDYSIEEAKVYNTVNNEDLGTIVQSIGFNDSEAFIIANVANKVTVSNRYTMLKSASITTDINNPRYIAFANGKGYLTNWGEGSDASDDYVAVIDLTTYTVIEKISVIEGPEQIVANGNTLYISHKGGWGNGNSVTVINADTNTVTTSISVGDVPDELFIDASGSLIVSCEGKAIESWNPNEILAKMVMINTSTNTVSSTLTFESGIHPNVMLASGSNIYFSTSNKVYEMTSSAVSLPNSAIIETPVGGMSVKDGKAFVTDVKDLVSNGSLKIFDLSTKQELKEFTVGLIPRKIYFN
jgi:YVTN family beta-propeller protein